MLLSPTVSDLNLCTERLPQSPSHCYRVIANGSSMLLEGCSCYLSFLPYTWRVMGSSKWGYKSPNMGYKYSYSTYDLP